MRGRVPSVRLTLVLPQGKPLPYYVKIVEALLCSHNPAAVLPGDQAASAAYLATCMWQPENSSDTCKSFKATQTVNPSKSDVSFSTYSASSLSTCSKAALQLFGYQ